MRIRGTGKSELLVGSSGADIIDGGGGNDTLAGGAGTDYLTGGRGADTFVMRAHSGYDVITDFNAAEGDHILLDLGGSASWDGLSFQTPGGTCYVSSVDINADGVIDTQLSINGDNLFLLGHLPADISGWSIFGG